MKIIINAAMTVDGKIATKNGDSDISSKADLKRLHRLRCSSDAIMVGISTVLIDDPWLTVRYGTSCPRYPARVVVDSTGRIPSNSKILKRAKEIDTIIATSNEASTYNIRRIEKTGAKVIVRGLKKVELRRVFRVLEKMGFRRILVEGGGEINWSVLKLGIADELIVTISPKIVGGRSAVTLAEGEGSHRISEGIPLELKAIRRYTSGEIVLFYKL